MLIPSHVHTTACSHAHARPVLAPASATVPPAETHEPEDGFSGLMSSVSHLPLIASQSATQPFDLLGPFPSERFTCIYCGGNGKCQDDYPRPGSGKDANGLPEYECSGTGRCYHCGGDGIRSPLSWTEPSILAV